MICTKCKSKSLRIFSEKEFLICCQCGTLMPIDAPKETFRFDKPGYTKNSTVLVRTWIEAHWDELTRLRESEMSWKDIRPIVQFHWSSTTLGKHYRDMAAEKGIECKPLLTGIRKCEIENRRIRAVKLALKANKTASTSDDLL